MDDEINPKTDQDKANRETKSGNPKLSCGEGTKSKQNSDQSPDKKDNTTYKRNWFCEHIRKPTFTDWVIALATLAICITGVQQWKIAKEQGKIFEKSNEISIATQRAFVNFSKIKGERIVDADKKKIIGIRFFVIWENSGTTPTKSARGAINIQAWPSELPKGFEFDNLSKLPPTPTVIGPKNTVSQAAFIGINPIIMTQEKKSHLYSWGSMIYNDIFPDTPARLTEYCVEITNIQGTKADLTDPDNFFRWESTPCTTHNCYDENCPDYDKRTKN